MKVYVEDLNLTLKLSMNSELKILNDTNTWDMKLKSNILNLIFQYYYGWTSVIVSGRIRINQSSLKLLSRFFYFQELLKDNITIKNPISFLKHTFKLVKKIIFSRRDYF